MPPPKNRADQAWSLIAGNSKLQALYVEILEVCIKSEEKLLIYLKWPCPLWLIETIIEIVQVGYASIRAGVNAADRKHAEYNFNHDPKVMVLVLSMLSAAEGLNLQ